MRHRRQKLHPEIPTSGIPDIAFLLLAFFMLTATFSVSKGLSINLPSDDVPQTTEGDEAVLVDILENGAIRVDCAPMAEHEIIHYLEPKVSRNPNKPVIIYAHADAHYRHMVRIYDALADASVRLGIEFNIHLATPRIIREYEAIFGVDPFAGHCR